MPTVKGLVLINSKTSLGLTKLSPWDNVLHPRSCHICEIDQVGFFCVGKTSMHLMMSASCYPIVITSLRISLLLVDQVGLRAHTAVIREIN